MAAIPDHRQYVKQKEERIDELEYEVATLTREIGEPDLKLHSGDVLAWHQLAWTKVSNPAPLSEAAGTTTLREKSKRLTGETIGETTTLFD